MARILIIDDADELRSMLRHMLEQAGEGGRPPHPPSKPSGTLTVLIPISATA